MNKEDFKYWKLFEASFDGHEVYFALTKFEPAEPLVVLTNEANEGYKIILMPKHEGSPEPCLAEFLKMEEYFWHEGYIEYMEMWYNVLNAYSGQFTDAFLDEVIEDISEEIKAKWIQNTELEYNQNYDGN